MKQKRYWLRGGIVGLVISILIIIFTLTFTVCWDWGVQTATYCHLLFPINGTIGGTPGIISCVLYIIYGIIIGWLYGKIKRSR